MQNYSVNITVSEKSGSYEATIRAEFSGLDAADGIEKKGEMVSLLLEKIKKHGESRGYSPAKHASAD